MDQDLRDLDPRVLIKEDLEEDQTMTRTGLSMVAQMREDMIRALDLESLLRREECDQKTLRSSRSMMRTGKMTGKMMTRSGMTRIGKKIAKALIS